MHAGGLQMYSNASKTLTDWGNKAEKACPERKTAIGKLVQLFKDCFKIPKHRPDMSKVAEDLDNIRKLCK